MKTLKNHTLLYDEDCPLCQVYTSGFIKTGLLDHHGRQAYSSISLEDQNFIDLQRASNEIALVDTNNKTVIYGIDSLLKVLGFRFPVIETIGHLKPIKFLLKKLYSFISYNRKVIIPSLQKKEQKLQCIPSFNTKYRTVYILFTILATTLTLFSFSNSITSLPKSSLIREGIITIGQIIFQGVLISKLSKNTILNYIGNLMTVSLMGSLLLIPILVVNSLIHISEPILLLWFSMVAILMFVEHFRRIKLLGLPLFLSYTWVLYRVLILLLILL